MKQFDVRLTIMRMGRQCSTCKQTFEGRITADDAEMAIRLAKEDSRADLETHKVKVNYVREVS